jgi:hypothetical protein
VCVCLEVCVCVCVEVCVECVWSKDPLFSRFFCKRDL